MSVYPQMVPYTAAPPPPTGDATGFNFRQTQNPIIEQNGETWAHTWQTHPWPTDFSIQGGGTYRAGWDGIISNTGFDTAGASDRRLKGGVAIATSGTSANGVFVLSGAASQTAAAAGTYRVRCAIGLYVVTNVYLHFYDGYTFDDLGTNRGTIRHTVQVTCQANEWTNMDSVARNEASWVSTYDSIFTDIVVTDQGVNTGLVMGKELTHNQWQYIAHLQVEKIA